MKILDDLNNLKRGSKVRCECISCKEEFTVRRAHINQVLNGKNQRTLDFCSKKCYTKYRMPNLKCCNCKKNFTRKKSQISKNKNVFCSKSCAASYNNRNKKYGNRRSKLEIWIEEQLKLIYPNLNILYNQKDAIDSELDIFIPSLNLAFELNGIFHYEPIYGKDKLDQIQNNDHRKYQACYEQGISLCIIDTSNQKYVKPATSKKFLDIIINIIEQNLSRALPIELPSHLKN